MLTAQQNLQQLLAPSHNSENDNLSTDEDGSGYEDGSDYGDGSNGDGSDYEGGEGDGDAVFFKAKVSEEGTAKLGRTSSNIPDSDDEFNYF